MNKKYEVKGRYKSHECPRTDFSCRNTQDWNNCYSGFFDCNKDKLLRDYGILYPNTYGYNNHFIYAVAISKPNYYSPNPLEKLGIGFEELAFKLKEEIQELRPDKVLLSSEDFMWHIHGLSKIVEVIKPIIVKVVVYLRIQDNAINSGCNELVKSDGVPVFLKSFLYTLYISLNYYEFLKNIKNSLRFDDSISISIIPRIYYRDFDKSWDAVEDFCDVLSIPKSVFTEHKNEINVSLSPTSTEALKRIKEKYLLPPGIFKKGVTFCDARNIKVFHLPSGVVVPGNYKAISRG